MISPVPPQARYALDGRYRTVFYEWLHAMFGNYTTNEAPVVLCAAPRRGRLYTLRPTTDCVRQCSGPLEHQQRCPAGLPNLHIPAFDLKVYWYQAAMRGAWTNHPVSLAQWQAVLRWVQERESQLVLTDGSHGTQATAVSHA